MSELLPTGTVTLLLADVEGSTRLWETQPDEMTAASRSSIASWPSSSPTHDGVRPVEQGEGDSFVIAFGRASDAVACALELQRAPLAPIRLRIGVHTGEVQLRDEGNYIGPTINQHGADARPGTRRPDACYQARQRRWSSTGSRRRVADRSRHPPAARCAPARTGRATVPSRHAQRVPTAAHDRMPLPSNPSGAAHQLRRPRRADQTKCADSWPTTGW